MDRCICIHGHFYQPPRENPWLEDVELQDSAYPFHDWNERITAECYEPNTAARILDSEGRIRQIVNNYHRISFNFGPTLLSWLERHQPETYQGIIDADRQSMELFDGHGSALAQAYNHIIMPLASPRDKEDQIVWGIRDFVHRFGRQPEGMWLPETAVDVATLEELAKQGIAFTILAPSQARRVRRLGETRWQSVEGAKIDPRMPYLCQLPSGASIHIFFYDGPISRDIGFSDLLSNGENFAHRLLGTFSDAPHAQLVHIATDGETYGHHRRFGEMALAYCLDYVERHGLARIVNYGQFLAEYPATHEVQIEENTSWSCFHGVERWRADCGCHSGANPSWNQAWRAPLRETLDWLRDKLEPIYEERAKGLLRDPWQARQDFIEVILNRSPQHVKAFLRRQAGRELTIEETRRALCLLEMQRQAMHMYTSCGWFFDEVTGIETTQVLGYAGRALQLAERLSGVALESDFIRRLERVPSNLPKVINAGRAYRQFVQPTRIDLLRVAAHVAIAAIFDGVAEQGQIYCYDSLVREIEELPAGRLKLILGRTRVRSDISWNEGEFAFAGLYLGGHHVNAGVVRYRDEQAFSTMKTEIRAAFERSDIPEVIRTMDRHFGTHTFTLLHLFKDEQRRITRQILAQTLEESEAVYRQIYHDHYHLIRFLGEIRMPVPTQLAIPFEVVLNAELRQLLEAETLDTARLHDLFEEVEKTGVHIDEATLGFVATARINNAMEKLQQHPEDLDLLVPLGELLDICNDLPSGLDLWKAQNAYFALWGQLREKTAQSAEGDEAAQEWLRQFRLLGRKLQLRMEE
jgi:alpha-amylase/alpha-mannosidase (GH57 family)